ncbi:signal peptidase I [Actinoalloteichus hoggarensis]|uniref:Signal peptidase I n=1 Tax=Actinoalloteichus hoggarensis TaxID=1470176 RepID=A0A221W0L1_9PSEU|nr:signal peptidase I [Actinoalloteichus hoggarensis]ASO19307.1 Signal peptidase I [Actinoalloteichus hoggarensis]MBB5920545.1 signal peptidase I [Actinoalloteichus hoggarensis]
MADLVPSTSPQGESDQPNPSDRPSEWQHRDHAGGAGHSGPSSADDADDGREKPSKPAKKGSFWRELFVLVGIAVVLTIVIQTFLARVYVIPSQSMEETLHGCAGCTNDRVLVDKITYRFTDPEPGDVVVFRGPEAWGQNDFMTAEPANPVARFVQNVGAMFGFAQPDEKDFVKRVIATGGQTVECCDEENRVLVDGDPLDEPYIFWQPGRGNTQEPFGPVTVPDDHIWMMGDNRNNSLDSRVQGGGGELGAVPLDNVIGKARIVVLPPQRWQGISDHDPQQSVLSAPAWQAAVPAGLGLLGAFPTLWLGRRLLGRRDRD